MPAQDGHAGPDGFYHREGPRRNERGVQARRRAGTREEQHEVASARLERIADDHRRHRRRAEEL